MSRKIKITQLLNSESFEWFFNLDCLQSFSFNLLMKWWKRPLNLHGKKCPDFMIYEFLEYWISLWKTARKGLKKKAGKLFKKNPASHNLIQNIFSWPHDKKYSLHCKILLNNRSCRYFKKTSFWCEKRTRKTFLFFK